MIRHPRILVACAICDYTVSVNSSSPRQALYAQDWGETDKPSAYTPVRTLHMICRDCAAAMKEQEARS